MLTLVFIFDPFRCFSQNTEDETMSSIPSSNYWSRSRLMHDDSPTQQDLEAAWLDWQAAEADASFISNERQQHSGHPFVGVAFLIALWPDPSDERRNKPGTDIIQISDYDDKIISVIVKKSIVVWLMSWRDIHW